MPEVYHVELGGTWDEWGDFPGIFLGFVISLGRVFQRVIPLVRRDDHCAPCRMVPEKLPKSPTRTGPLIHPVLKSAHDFGLM